MIFLWPFKILLSFSNFDSKFLKGKFSIEQVWMILSCTSTSPSFLFLQLWAAMRFLPRLLMSLRVLTSSSVKPLSSARPVSTSMGWVTRAFRSQGLRPKETARSSFLLLLKLLWCYCYTNIFIYLLFLFSTVKFRRHNRTIWVRLSVHEAIQKVIYILLRHHFSTVLLQLVSQVWWLLPYTLPSFLLLSGGRNHFSRSKKYW